MRRTILILLVSMSAGCRTYHKLVDGKSDTTYHGAIQPSLPASPSVANGSVTTYSGAIPYVAYVMLPEGGKATSYVVVYVYENGQWIQVPEFVGSTTTSYVYDKSSGLGAIVRFKYTTNDMDMYCIYLVTPNA